MKIHGWHQIDAPFSSQNNDYLQIREISQYPRPVQGQGHIRVKNI
jgi:hypothetical protein